MSTPRKVRGQVRQSDRGESSKHRLPFQSMNQRWAGHGFRRHPVAWRSRPASRRRRSPRGVRLRPERPAAFGIEGDGAANASNRGRAWHRRVTRDAWSVPARSAIGSTRMIESVRRPAVEPPSPAAANPRGGAVRAIPVGCVDCRGHRRLARRRPPNRSPACGSRSPDTSVSMPDRLRSEG